MTGIMGVISYGIGTIIGFGSTNDLREPGSIIFVNHPYPVRVLKREHVRIVQTANQSIALNMLYPYPTVDSRNAAGVAVAATAAA